VDEYPKGSNNGSVSMQPGESIVIFVMVFEKWIEKNREVFFEKIT
jgi:hypothetical protein